MRDISFPDVATQPQLSGKIELHSWENSSLAPHRSAPCPPDPPNAPFASETVGIFSPQKNSLQWEKPGGKVGKKTKTLGTKLKKKNLGKLGRCQMLNVQLYWQIACVPMRNARCSLNLPNHSKSRLLQRDQMCRLRLSSRCESQTMHINC